MPRLIRYLIDERGFNYIQMAEYNQIVLRVDLDGFEH